MLSDIQHLQKSQNFFAWLFQYSVMFLICVIQIVFSVFFWFWQLLLFSVIFINCSVYWVSCFCFESFTFRHDYSKKVVFLWKKPLWKNSFGNFSNRNYLFRITKPFPSRHRPQSPQTDCSCYAHKLSTQSCYRTLQCYIWPCFWHVYFLIWRFL